MVDALAVAVLEMVKSFIDPVPPTRPSMLTASAPFKSISGAARFPLMIRPVTVG